MSNSAKRLGKEHAAYRQALIDACGGAPDAHQIYLVDSAAELHFRIEQLMREPVLTPAGQTQLSHFRQRLDELLRALGNIKLQRQLARATGIRGVEVRSEG